MSDELDDLKAAMRSATPKPDPQRRAENLALAQKNFDAHQGEDTQPRLTSDRPTSGLWTGVRRMFASFGLRGALVTSTCLVAGAFVLMGPLRDSLTDLRSPVFEVSGTGLNSQPLQEELAVPQSARPAPARAAEDFSVSAPLSQPSPAPKMLQRDTIATDRMARPEPAMIVEPNTESFANTEPSRLQITAESPVSTFSIDVDTASYAILRNSLLSGHLPPKEAVRIEEMINYFSYDYPTPEGDAAFVPSIRVSETPWNPGTQLVQIGIQGAQVTERPPLNLVFLVDTSGSMQAANKLPLLKQSLSLLLGQLQPEDQIAIVSYAGSAGEVLGPTPASDRRAIMAALEGLSAGGSTAGQAGLQQAYALAETMAEEGDVSRVVLATDGDFNVGLSDPVQLKDYIAGKRETGIYLSVLGFGRGNLDDATMQALAQNGNGQAAYIDTLSEAQKVLVDQASGAFFPIADDVKIQVEFNPAQISEYRLIGYETRSLRREDFNNDAVDAGEIGAGTQVTALYEVTPVGSVAELTEPLRYGAARPAGQSSDELGFLRLRYKRPGAEVSDLIEMPIEQPQTLETPGFAAAIAGFGALLRGSAYMGDWGFEEAIALAQGTRGADVFGYRTEAMQLMRLAQSLSQQ